MQVAAEAGCEDSTEAEDLSPLDTAMRVTDLFAPCVRLPPSLTWNWRDYA